MVETTLSKLGVEMKTGFYPLFFGCAMLAVAVLFTSIDMKRSRDIEARATELRTFLEDHRTNSASHRKAYQQSKDLETLVAAPNRTPLVLLSLIIAALHLSAFFRNEKGRRITSEFVRIWTWRP